MWLGGRFSATNDYLNEKYGPTEISEHLKWGMFYFNREDKRAMVSDGSATTLNFAHPMAMILLAVILTPLITLVLVAILTG